MNRELHLVGLNHKKAPVEVRERFALSESQFPEQGLIPLDGDICEYLVLSTCNRVELLAVARKDGCADALLEYWARARGESPRALRPYVYMYTDADAVRHLFTVASSLDSMVLGEPQILGQLKKAYRTAVQNKTARLILNKLLHKAFSTAKRVRTETAVAASAVSISYAAVELARKIFDDMRQVSAMLIGAGEMAELAATHLVNAGIASIRVANRTHERAAQLATRFGGQAVLFDDLAQHLPLADIVISSTGAPEPIIRAQDMHEVLRKRKNKPMFFIDIAVPRDIDPAVNNLDNIYLYDIDDLKEVVEENLAGRREEAIRAQRIVGEESDIFCRWLKSLDLQPTIVDLLRKSERIAQHELERSLKRLGPLPEGSREILTAMLSSVVKKLNHEPIMFLKRHVADEEDTSDQYINLIRRVFNLDAETCLQPSQHGRKHDAEPAVSPSRSELS